MLHTRPKKSSPSNGTSQRKLNKKITKTIKNATKSTKKNNFFSTRDITTTTKKTLQHHSPSSTLFNSITTPTLASFSTINNISNASFDSLDSNNSFNKTNTSTSNSHQNFQKSKIFSKNAKLSHQFLNPNGSLNSHMIITPRRMLASYRGVRDPVKIPENYKPIDRSKQQSKLAKQQKLADERNSTMPGEYTIYESEWKNIPILSLVIMSLISVSNIPMFSHWADQQLWDLPAPALYAMGAGTVLGLGYAHVSMSRRWLKKITVKIHEKNKAPTHVKIRTGGLIGLGEDTVVPVTAFRGLALTHKEDHVDIVSPHKPLNLNSVITIACDIPQNYLIAWVKDSHWANPAGLLSKILDMKNVDGVVTSKGHTFDGKRYSDEDYEAVMEKMKQSKNRAGYLLPSEMKEELDKSINESLTYEKSRGLGIFTRGQEMECLEMAKRKYINISKLHHKLKEYEATFQHNKIQAIKDQIIEETKSAKDDVSKAQRSMVQKALHVYNPEVDFNGYSTEDAMELFKSVLETQKTGRHPRTALVTFNFGNGNNASDVMVQLAQMYMKNKPLKYYFGEKNTPTEGVLTVLFKQIDTSDMKKGDNNNDSAIPQTNSINLMEVPTNDSATTTATTTTTATQNKANDKLMGNVPDDVKQAIEQANRDNSRAKDEFKM